MAAPKIVGALTRETNAGGIIIIGVLFFVIGFVTWLGSVLIPYLKIACELTTFAAYFVAFSFYISYALMAIPSAAVLKRTGSKKGMALGLFLMSLGALLFVPAALTRQYWIFLLGLFIQGAGLTLLQSAANPYVTKLGPPESAARRISFMGISNGIAGVMAPLVLGFIILNDTAAPAATDNVNADVLNELARRVIVPYVGMAVILIVLAASVYLSRLPEIDTDEEDAATTDANREKKTVFQFPHLLLGVITLFLYVGVEVIAVDTIFGFAESQGVAPANAKFFSSFTILNMLAGYLIGIVCIPRFIKQQQALGISALAGILFFTGAMLTAGVSSVVFVALLGLANALIWPSMWPLALAGLGRFTQTGSSMLIMAIGGGAILPLGYGWLAQHYDPHFGYWIVLPGYAMILFYAVRGHKIITPNL